MELNAKMMMKVESAFMDNRLVGDAIFSDDEYEILLSYTRSFSVTKLKNAINKMPDQNEKAYFLRLFNDENIALGTQYERQVCSIFVTLVEIAKRWEKSDDDDEQGFWSYVLKTLFNNNGNKQTFNNMYVEIIKKLERVGKIQKVETRKKYYAAVMMHSFAPTKSINAFLDLCYNIYKKDIGFNYTERDKWVCDAAVVQLRESLKNTTESNKVVSLGSNSYNMKIGLRSLASSNEEVNDFSVLLDRALIAINKLFHKQGISQDTYFDNKINKWWQLKADEVADDKKLSQKGLSAVTKQTFAVKFIRSDKKVKLGIPPIRLDGNGTSVWLSVFAGENLQQRFSDELFTRNGEIAVTTVQKEFELNELLGDDKSIKVYIELAENGVVILDKTIEREFILFEDENEIFNKINKINNYFVYTRNTDAQRMPKECNTYASNLYNIYPQVGEVLSGVNSSVYFVDKESTNNIKCAASLLGGFSNCEWRANGIECKVFGEGILLFVPKGTAINGLELGIGEKKELLTELQYIQEEDGVLFDISNKILPLEPVKLSLYSHLKENNLIQENIIVFECFNIAFSKKSYYGDDEKKLTISIDGNNNILEFDNFQSEVIYTINEGELVVKIPFIKWRIDERQWSKMPWNKPMWYKDNFHNGSLLEVESPIDMEDVVLYAGVNGSFQDVVERRTGCGKFEIGKYIFSHENQREIAFLLKSNKEVQTIELFVVSTAEYFQAPPLAVVGDNVVFVGGDSFVGSAGRKFMIEFGSLSKETIVIEAEKLKNGVIPDFCEGIYYVKVQSKGGGMFNNSHQVFWQKEFIFGDPEKLKLSKTILRIYPIVGISVSGEFWRAAKEGYRITGLKRSDVEKDTYTARIYHTDEAGNETKVGGASNCMIERLSTTTLSLLVADEKGGYSKKLSFDQSLERITEPNLPGKFRIANYHFLEVKDV